MADDTKARVFAEAERLSHGGASISRPLAEMAQATCTLIYAAMLAEETKRESLLYTALAYAAEVRTRATNIAREMSPESPSRDPDQETRP